MTYAARIAALLKTCTPLEDLPQPFDQDRSYSEREIDRLNSDKELRCLVPELLKEVAELSQMRERVAELERDAARWQMHLRLAHSKHGARVVRELVDVIDAALNKESA